MTQFYPPPPVARPVAEPIVEDIPCRRCQYNLRGLDSSALCPECATPVALSIQGNLIRHSDPRWIARLARGADWGFLTCILLLVLGALQIWNQIEHLFDPWVNRMLFFAIDLFAACAVWFLTTPDPSGIGEDQYATSRKFARLGSCINSAQAMCNAILYEAHLPPTVFVAVSAISCGVGLSGSTGFIARMQYLSRLAARIADARIIKQTRNLRYTLGIPFNAMMLMTCLNTAARALGKSPTIRSSQYAVAYGLIGLCFIVFGVAYMLMLNRLGTKLRVQYVLAEQSWNQIKSNDIPSPPV